MVQGAQSREGVTPEVLSTDQLYYTGVKFNLQIEGSCAQSEKEGIPFGEAGLNKGTVRRKCEDCRGISKKISAAGVWAGWWGELGKEHRKEVWHRRWRASNAPWRMWTVLQEMGSNRPVSKTEEKNGVRCEFQNKRTVWGASRLSSRTRMEPEDSGNSPGRKQRLA